MPEDIQPCAALHPRTKQAVRRKGARKGQRMRNHDQSAKKIAICQDQERTGGSHDELVKQQNSGNKVGDEYCG